MSLVLLNHWAHLFLVDLFVMWAREMRQLDVGALGSADNYSCAIPVISVFNCGIVVFSEPARAHPPS